MLKSDDIQMEQNETLNIIEIKFPVLSTNNVLFEEMKKGANIQSLREEQTKDVWRMIDWTMKNVYEPEMNRVFLAIMREKINNIGKRANEIVEEVEGIKSMFPEETPPERMAQLAGIKKETS